jgi:ethanolamine utilization microcompartment shell protein EutS
MKKVKSIMSILENIGFIAGFAGVILFFGSVGAFERELISFTQFAIQELIAAGCVATSYCALALRTSIKEQFIKD